LSNIGKQLALILGLALGCSSGRQAFADMRYEAKIVGASDTALADLLDDVSQLKALEERVPASEEALRRRADEDLRQLLDAAHSLGYWHARLSYAIDTNHDPAKVTITVDPGPVYHVAAINLLGPDGKPLMLPAESAAPPLPLQPGDAARTAPVIATENALLASLGRSGHPFAKAIERHVVINHAAHTMTVTYTLDPGPEMRFGRAAITGLKRLDPAYVERRFRWRKGETYDNRKVEETRKGLIESGLFSTVKITPAADPTDPRRAVMQVAAVERAHHTIGAGLGYNTSEGAGARLFWEDRNLFGDAEYLHLSLAVGQQKNAVVANLRRPDLFATDQDLLGVAEIADETPVAYHSRRVRVAPGLERRFDQHLTGGVSLSFEKADVVEEAVLSSTTARGRTQRYALLGVPLYLKLDRSDDLLNPTRGYRAQASLVPYQSISGPALRFLSGRLSGSVYRRLDDDGRYVIAAAAAVSSIDGASLAELPADKRIYAGGGGSIRAYGYQMAGPLDFDKKPIGGRSSLELSLEARIKITDRIGIVPFVDAGSYYRSILPQLDQRLLWGPGLGFRYYTPFGPIRLDIATPFVRRRGDSPIQVYISLGQAF
jgi:translocation and assembly module TamA